MKKSVLLFVAIFVAVIVFTFSCKRLDVPVPGNTCIQVTRTSAAGTDSQMVAVNAPIVPITYTFSGNISADTSAIDTIHVGVVGTLPPGVTSSLVNGIFTISGTPTSKVGSPFTYTLASTGTSCNTTKITGTITVTDCTTLTLVSNLETIDQTPLVNTAISPITYSVGLDGAGTTVTGLPRGVTGSYVAGMFVISGTATTRALTDSEMNSVSYPYTVTTACGGTDTGTIVVKVPLDTTQIVTFPSYLEVCNGTAGANVQFNDLPNATITYTINGGANQTIFLDGTGTAILPTGSISAAGVIYRLVSTSLPTPHALSGEIDFVLAPIPTATISGTTSIVSGASTNIVFSGVPNTIITYTINGGHDYSIGIGASGQAILGTGPLAINTTYTLISASGEYFYCAESVTGSAVITIRP